MQARCPRRCGNTAEDSQGCARADSGLRSAYEAGCLAENGFDVLAIDFSPAAVELAKRNLPRFGDIVRIADFFDFDSGMPYDVVYERAFLCALPPQMWPQYAPRAAQLLRPKGELAGFFFFKETEKGPLFGTNLQALHAYSTHISSWRNKPSPTRSRCFRAPSAGRLAQTIKTPIGGLNLGPITMTSVDSSSHSA